MGTVRREGAQIGLMNVGGVRSDLPMLPPRYGEQAGQITFAEAFDIAPFGNVNVVLDLTGAQLKQVLEQQYQPVAGPWHPPDARARCVRRASPTPGTPPSRRARGSSPGR